MSTKAKRPAQRPKLERKYALKNVNYDASISSTSSPSYSYDYNDGDDDHSSITQRTRSLDLSPNDRTSFRIEGVDGEFDRICRSLGLSGPEDFAIPAAAWEARRNNSPSGGFPSSRFRDQYNSPTEVRVSDDVINNEKIDGKSGGGGGGEVRVRVVVDDVGLISERRAGDGIKGLRPPPLLDPPGGRMLAPPPVKRLVVVDDMTSTWDICRSFGPEDEEDVVVVDDDDRVEGNEDVSSERNVVREVVNGARLSDSTAFSESCSDTSEFENDDVYSVRSEPLSGISPTTISPNGIFRGSNKSWQKGEFLGSGSFGTVYEGFTDDGFFFAVKEVSLLDQGPQGKQSILQLEQEISLLSRFQHENIVRYHGTESDDGKLYIFLELVAKGSLASLYQKYHLKDSQVSAYTRQILNGLNYLHKQNVVHRDIKCANILVDVSGSVKLADFGLAKATTLNDVKSCKGTAFWMAPEVVNRKNHGYGLAADIWSLGCTVLEMLTRQVPYSHLEGMQALFRIGRGEPPPLPDSLSTDAKDFILKCLVVNPDKRPTAAQLLDHPFVKRSSFSTFPSPASPHLAGMRSL